MRDVKAKDAIRAAARAYEQALPAQQRKQLGQFFTGLPLGKLLAHLALDSDIRAVLDPMAGHGDLLDAAWEAATEHHITLDRLDGIEIDETTAAACRSRLAEITDGRDRPTQQIIPADAFNLASEEKLSLGTYDLVITNPPYVRYQARNGNGTTAERVRSGLAMILNNRLSAASGKIWNELATGYSGLADLSVPSWLLAAAMVRPGGRLALVVPATWRSRDYADVIRYLMLRCFSLEWIVEDKQPGWFSDALVRTHLIVARRLTEEDIAKPLQERPKFSETLWLQVAPEAAVGGSLVGAAFPGTTPEAQFAAWVRNDCKESKCGITVRPFNLHDEWRALETRITHRRWYQRLEDRADDTPLFVGTRSTSRVTIPDTLKTVLPDGFSPDTLVTIEDAGIQVGQGLRTGCNKFFYVTMLGPSGPGMVRVEASSLFGNREFSVPSNALRPVLRRQSEIPSLEGGRLLEGGVLNLRGWVLPEDFHLVTKAQAAYVACGEMLPKSMPDELAGYVRDAACVPAADAGDNKRIPDLSAVRTNVRMPRNGRVTPRFWYMLPDFAPRHLPAVFVARINHGLPWVETNLDPPVLIDANFSTFWPVQGGWTYHALKALLNSVWCRAFMEASGTPFGGGALKLEATHLRQMAIPILSDAAKRELSKAGMELTKNAAEIQRRVDAIILDALLTGTTSLTSTDQLAKVLAERASNMSCARQRAA